MEILWEKLSHVGVQLMLIGFLLAIVGTLYGLREKANDGKQQIHFKKGNDAGGFTLSTTGLFLVAGVLVVIAGGWFENKSYESRIAQYEKQLEEQAALRAEIQKALKSNVQPTITLDGLDKLDLKVDNPKFSARYTVNADTEERTVDLVPASGNTPGKAKRWTMTILDIARTDMITELTVVCLDQPEYSWSMPIPEKNGISPLMPKWVLERD